MRIAVCENDPYELGQIVKILDNYRRETNAALVYQTFTNAHDLLEEVRKDVFDALFLDVLMPVMTGVQAAREVRGFNDEVKIVFLTVSSEFAVESYAVKAYDYLLKPSTNETVFPILDRIRHQKEMQEECLAVKFQSGIANLAFSKLACIEVLNRTLFFHLFDGTERELNAPLADYEDLLLARGNFVKVHRSFLVNLCHVEELGTSSIRMRSGKIVPVSRRFYPKVRTAYMEHLFLETE